MSHYITMKWKMSLGLFYEWTYAGVDHSIEGNGGPECIGFIPTWQKILETSIVCPIAIMEIIYGLRNISLPVKQVNPRSHFTTAKSIMLVAHCLVFGIELGFKFASRQMIWILNTCHVNTMLQIYLLAAPPSRFLTAMFRLHVHTLAGAVIAILLPVLNTRLVPLPQKQRTTFLGPFWHMASSTSITGFLFKVYLFILKSIWTISYALLWLTPLVDDGIGWLQLYIRLSAFYSLERCILW